MGIVGFEWDDGNRGKCLKHGLSIEEIESVFEGVVMILPDVEHSAAETRFKAIGQSVGGRHVFLVFTIREMGGDRCIRVISARYMHSKEVEHYEKENPGL